MALSSSSSSQDDWDASFGNLKEKYPVFATEVGFQKKGIIPEPPYDEEDYAGEGKYRNAIKSYLEGKKISWTAWCFSPYTGPTLLKDKNFTPNEAGRFIRKWLLQKK